MAKTKISRFKNAAVDALYLPGIRRFPESRIRHIQPHQRQAADDPLLAGGQKWRSAASGNMAADALCLPGIRRFPESRTRRRPPHQMRATHSWRVAKMAIGRFGKRGGMLHSPQCGMSPPHPPTHPPTPHDMMRPRISPTLYALRYDRPFQSPQCDTNPPPTPNSMMRPHFSPNSLRVQGALGRYRALPPSLSVGFFGLPCIHPADQ